MPVFARYIGLDYSSAQTPTASLKGLCVYLAEDDAAPVEIPPPPSPRMLENQKQDMRPPDLPGIARGPAWKAA